MTAVLIKGGHLDPESDIQREDDAKAHLILK